MSHGFISEVAEFAAVIELVFAASSQGRSMKAIVKGRLPRADSA